jgi:molybdopterin-guanine dinucleotide biosynthesis protein A
MDAVILAGGRASRLGGVDKTRLVVGGRTLLQRAVDAVPDAQRVIVVGPPTEIADARVRFVQEEPAGSGPLAALAAALPLIERPLTEDSEVVILGADLPWIAAAVPALLAARGDHDVAVLTDADGRRNFVAAAWSTAALRAQVERLRALEGRAIRDLYAGPAAADVAEVLDRDGWGQDCDTWDDVRTAQEVAGE